jgi:hypothetical protein
MAVGVDEARKKGTMVKSVRGSGVDGSHVLDATVVPDNNLHVRLEPPAGRLGSLTERRADPSPISLNDLRLAHDPVILRRNSPHA